MRFGDSQRRLAILGLENIVARTAQNLQHDGANGLFVVHEKDCFF